MGSGSDVKRSDSKADLTIKYGGKSFKVHKRVMMSASEFFGKVSLIGIIITHHMDLFYLRFRQTAVLCVNILYPFAPIYVVKSR